MSNVKAGYRHLGKTGLRISVPILGGMSIGDPNWNPVAMPEDKAFPVLKAAWDAGVTTWDLANMYSNGLSETIVGKFIKENNIPRKKLVLIDKIRFLVDQEQPSTITSYFRPELRDTRDYVNQGGLSRTAIFNQVEDCLERLGTDYIDILFIHAFDPMTPIEETMCALNDVVRSGKARYLGTTNVKVWQLVEMNNVAKQNGWTQFSCVQVEHSLLYRAEERDMFDYCNYKGLGITTFSPLAEGYLARPLGVKTPRSKFVEGTPFEKKWRKSDIQIIERVASTAEKCKWTMAQVTLAWSLTKGVAPIVGANSPERLQDAVAVVGKTLTDQDVAHLEEPYEERPLKWYDPNYF